MPSLVSGLTATPALIKTLGLASLLLVAAAPIHHANPWSMLWTAPLLLLASLFIAWAAESAQFFIAQGFALAILAWLQTLPEFAVEAVLAWHQETELLLSNLTGALRLLTGVGWPLIYGTAAVYHRLKKRGALRKIQLEPVDSAQVFTLLVSLVWVFVVFFKASLGVWDAAVLIGVYAAYLVLLNRLPPESPEEIENMEVVPRTILRARPVFRNIAIALLFLAGGGLILVVAEPFLGSLLAVSAAAGISQFVAVQWIAPFVSEFPEKVSAFYWAKSIDRAPMALMNMVSSNINQWTLLAAMLPLVLSFSVGAPTAIHFDRQQSLELLMTLLQSLLGALLLLDMELAWWEAGLLFVLWAVQFGFSVGGSASYVHAGVTIAYGLWCLFQVVRLIAHGRLPAAFPAFRQITRSAIR